MAILSQIMPDDLRVELRAALPPFYQTVDFWIFFILGVAGVYFSVRAFLEAERAKQAAAAAGRNVKIQTVTIELTEILQRLDVLDDTIPFSEARDMLNEVSRRLRRLVPPFASSPQIKSLHESLKIALTQTKEALDGVRPTLNSAANDSPNAVYYALQGHFGTISEQVAEILGALESMTITTQPNV